MPKLVAILLWCWSCIVCSKNFFKKNMFSEWEGKQLVQRSALFRFSECYSATNIPRHLLCFLLTILDFCRTSTSSQQMYNLLSGQNRLKSALAMANGNLWQSSPVSASILWIAMDRRMLRYTRLHTGGPLLSSALDHQRWMCHLLASTMWGRKNKKITCLTCRKWIPQPQPVLVSYPNPKGVHPALATIRWYLQGIRETEPNKTQHLGGDAIRCF